MTPKTFDLALSCKTSSSFDFQSDSNMQQNWLKIYDIPNIYANGYCNFM